MAVVDRIDRVVRALEKEAVIASIRLTNTAQIVRAFNSILLGGLSIFEIPIQAPKWAEIVRKARAEFGDDILLGVGGVLDRRGALNAIQAGADYVCSPHTERGIVELCKEEQTLIMQGGLTPNEVFRAYQTGADYVSVTPASFYGQAYMESLLFTYGDVKLIPSGGVDDKLAGALLASGARAVGVDTWLVNDKMIQDREFDQIQQRAVSLKKIAATAKPQAAPMPKARSSRSRARA